MEPEYFTKNGYNLVRLVAQPKDAQAQSKSIKIIKNPNKLQPSKPYITKRK